MSGQIVHCRHTFAHFQCKDNDLQCHAKVSVDHLVDRGRLLCGPVLLRHLPVHDNTAQLDGIRDWDRGLLCQLGDGRGRHWRDQRYYRLFDYLCSDPVVHEAANADEAETVSQCPVLKWFDVSHAAPSFFTDN